MVRILLIGNGAREHVIAEAVKRSAHNIALFSCMKSNNPGIASLSEDVLTTRYDDREKIGQFARENNIDFAIIGPEDPLNNGIVDFLKKEAFHPWVRQKAWQGWKHQKTLREIFWKSTISPEIPDLRYFLPLQELKSLSAV